MRTRLAGLMGAVVLMALPATAEASTLAGYWPMYEGKGQVVHDISGNHNDGRLGSSRSTDGRDADWVNGLLGVGDALRFDGNDYIAIPDVQRRDGLLRLRRQEVVPVAVGQRQGLGRQVAPLRRLVR